MLFINFMKSADYNIMIKIIDATFIAVEADSACNTAVDGTGKIAFKVEEKERSSKSEMPADGAARESNGGSSNT